MSLDCFFVENLESRRLMAGQYPLGIGFNDEALWDENFPSSVATCQQLGIKTVRLWMPMVTYTDRPTPWDDAPAAGQADTGLTSNGGTTSPSRVLRRAFQLKQLGFNVLMVFANETGVLPTSSTDVTSYFSYMLNVPQSPGSAVHLSDVVDRWEIGNEPDLKTYWNDPSLDVNIRIKDWVKQFLIPAADTLKAAGETTVSGGPSSSPAHIKLILDTLNSAGKIGSIDYVGYHPYATFNPNDPAGANLQRDNVLKAKGYADGYGKQMVASEWNVRGYGNFGAYDSTWIQAVDLNFRNVIRDSFESAYYFCLINNWAARGGSTSARPGGILQHPAAATKGITPTSSLSALTAYYASGLVVHNPFYNVIANWRLGSVSGTLFNDLNGSGTRDVGESGLAGQTVFIDFNGNGALDTGETSTTSAADGSYTLSYDLSAVPAGKFNIVAPVATGWQQTTPIATAVVTAANVVAGVNIGQKQSLSANFGTIAGIAFRDDDGDGALDGAEPALAGRAVYLDANNDGQLTAGEPSAVSDASGNFVIAYDTTVVLPGIYTVRQSVPAFWDETTSPGGYPVTIAPADQGEALLFGSRPQSGSVGGTVFNDVNANGVFDAGDLVVQGRTVYVDANNNSVFDAGEFSAVTDVNGQYIINYLLASLAPAAYNLRQVLPTNWNQTTPTASLPQVFSAGAGAVATGEDFGSVYVAPAVGSISGYLWSDTDGNGVMNGTEPLLSARVVWIDTNKDGIQNVGEPTATTDAGGVYKFSNLPVGTYRVRRVLPAGYRVSSPLAGYWDITLTSGQNVTTANIGATQRAMISGTVFFDANKNAAQDAAESNLSNWTVYIDANGNNALDAGERTALTDAQGNWAFVDLVNATYKFKVQLQAGYAISTPTSNLQTVALAVGQIKTGVKFGVKTIA